MADEKKNQNSDIRAYDASFKTLLDYNSHLVIPLVNEVFQQNIPYEASYIQLNTEQIHHPSPDNSILIRMYQYDAETSIQNSVIINNELHVNFPSSAVIYLRDVIYKESLSIVIHTNQGIINHNVKVLNIHDYSLGELFEKKLYIYTAYVRKSIEKRYALLYNLIRRW